MMRRAMVVVLMIVGITLLVWAGVHNARERRLAMQQSQAARVTLTPEGKAGAGADDAEMMTPRLQGKVAPPFTLTDLDGKKVSLAQFKGHPVFVNFWATWCEPCKLEMPWLQEFSQKYAASGLVILGVSTDDPDVPKSVVAGIAKKLGVTYPILLNDDKVAETYDIEADPTSVYVDKTGKVLIETSGIYSGQGGKDMIEANIRKLIAEGGQ